MPVASAVAQQEISQQQSLTLMRNMMRLHLSNVCHGRGLFPESDFERRDVCQLEGVPSLGHREGPVTAEAIDPHGLPGEEGAAEAPDARRRPPLKRESQTRTRQKCSSKV